MSETAIILLLSCCCCLVIGYVAGMWHALKIDQKIERNTLARAHVGHREWGAFFERAYLESGAGDSLTMQELYKIACARNLLSQIMGDGDDGQRISRLRLALPAKRDEIVGGYQMRIEKDPHTKHNKYLFSVAPGF